MKSSRPSTKSIYSGGSCWSKGRSCLTTGGPRFSSCLIAASACCAIIIMTLAYRFKNNISNNPWWLVYYPTFLANWRNFQHKQNDVLVLSAIVTEITLHNTVAKWKIDAKPKKEMKKYGKP
jgi:hypothetical protein